MYFPVHHWARDPTNSNHYSGYSTCGSCQFPICFHVISLRGKVAPESNRDLTRAAEDFLVQVFPEPEKTEVPEHVPESAARAFTQAVESRVAGHYDAAGAMYRKALDVGLKAIDPLLKGRLQERIDKLAAGHKLTPSIKDWAHDIRLDGNDAAHEEDPFTKGEAEQMHLFTQLVLTYLFTLPEKVKLRGKPKGEEKKS
jgi:Domain of unknown function (DUF4145)